MATAHDIAKDVLQHLQSQNGVYENPELQEPEEGDGNEVILVGLDDQYFSIKIEEF